MRSVVSKVETIAVRIITYVGKCKKKVVDVVRKYFSLIVDEEYDILSVMETTAYEMTAALSILNLLLENGYDKSELSGKRAP